MSKIIFKDASDDLQLIKSGNTINVFDTLYELSKYMGHDYVEIGGLKWATMNVGANSVTDYGLFYSWGGNSGCAGEQVGSLRGFECDEYEFADSSDCWTMTKYNSTDHKSTLELVDDAARNTWGGLWRIPSSDDFDSLNEATNQVWTSNYQGSGVAGLICTDKTDSSKALFLPAAGWCYDGDWHDKGTMIACWGTSIGYEDSIAMGTNIGEGMIMWGDTYDRYNGLTIRPVIG